MKVASARTNARYQVVLPKPVRDALDVQPGDELLFLVDGDTVTLRPKPDSFTDMLHGLHREIWPDPDVWLQKEQSTWE